MTLDEYLDAAITRSGISSNRQLCKRLGVTSSVASFWRTKRTWPSDDVMVKIALMAGKDPEQALLDLNSWRTEGAARAVYERLAQRIAGTAAALAVLLPITLAAPDAKASPAPALSEAAANIHYAQIASSCYALCA